MAYTPTTWADGSAPDIDAANLNHLETGVQAAAATADAAVPKPASPASNDALVWNGSSWVNAKIADANVSASAAIAYSKLALTGSIVNADIASAAAIAASKLAGYPSDVTKFLAGNGTWIAVTQAKTVTGIIPATGTTPTAGTGFTYTHTNTSGIYVVTFSVAFSATPFVKAEQEPSAGADQVAKVTAVSSTGFTVQTGNTAGVLADRAFSFLAYQVS